MLNVGILALVAAFNSGALSIQRASQTATAATLAEKQMELYRAQQYANVALEASLRRHRPAGTRPTPATPPTTRTQVTKVCAGPPYATQCQPMRTATGPDGISYRIDTYMVNYTPTNGRAVKKVTVVVRHAAP